MENNPNFMEAITRNNALIEELIRTMRGGAGGNINNGEAPQPQPQPQQEEADIGANTTAPKKETAQALVIRHKKRRVFTRTGPVNGKVGVRCFKCGDRGHFAKACKNAGKKCYTCEEFGHISPECPKNKTESESERPETSAVPDEMMLREEEPMPVAMMVREEEPMPSCSTAPIIDNFGNNNKSRPMFITLLGDSGASQHMIKDELVLKHERNMSGKILGANVDESTTLRTTKRGDIELKESENNKLKELKNVLFSPDLAENLLSLGKIAEQGLHILLTNKMMRVFKPDSEKFVIPGEDILIGKYVKPYWQVELEIESPEREQEISLNDRKRVFLTTDEANEQLSNKIPRVEEESILEKENSQQECPKDVENSEQESTKEGEKDEKIESSESDNFKVNESLDQSKSVDFSISMRELDDMVSKMEIDEKAQEEITNGEGVKILKIEENKRENLRENLGLLWHIRMGHMSLKYLKEMQKKNAVLRDVHFDDSILDCEVCALAKMKRLPFSETRTRASEPLDLIHTDVMGPITPHTFKNKFRWVVTFVDDFSRFAVAYVMNKKSEVGDCFEMFIKSLRNHCGKFTRVKNIRCDNGTEYVGGKMKEICERENIDMQLTEPGTPSHNGVAERFNLTIQEKVRSMLYDSGLPHNFWDVTLGAAIHLYNRSPHASIDFEKPIEKFLGEECRLSQIKRFGCIAYVHKNKSHFTKLETRALIGVLVGYTATGYKILLPSSKRIVRAKHVRFVESKTYADLDKNTLKETEEENEITSQFEIIEKPLPNNDEESTENDAIKERETESIGTGGDEELKNCVENADKEMEASAEKSEDEFEIDEIECEEIEADFTRALSMFTETIKNLKENSINKDEEYVALITELNEDPQSFEEAMRSSESEQWKAAVTEELDSMTENQVWEIVDRPKSRVGWKPNILDSRMIFKKKREVDGSFRYKARLVIRGFKDKNEYELSEIYAPVSQISTIKAGFSLINKFDLDAYHLDVKTAFLHGELEEDEEIYMEIPEGIDMSPQERKSKVCKLRKSLYGLKQSPNRWNKKFAEIAAKLGFEHESIDPCLFFFRKKNFVCFLLLYVDDFLLAGNNKAKLLELIEHFKREIKVVNLGEPKRYLGIEINRDRKNKRIVLGQSEYCGKVLERFGMANSKPQDTPMATRNAQKDENKNMRAKEEEKRDITPCFPYREAIGSLLYLANLTRPDISYAVNFLSRKQISPTNEDWTMVKRVFRYLNGTRELGLVYESKTEKLDGFADASFGDCPVTRKSTMGVIVKLFGDLVYWTSKRQGIIANSTCEAEYVALNQATLELIAMNSFIRRAVGKTFTPFTLHGDNTASIQCTAKSGSPKLKHLTDIKLHYILDCVTKGLVKLRWVPSGEQEADFLTKALPRVKFLEFRKRLMSD